MVSRFAGLLLALSLCAALAACVGAGSSTAKNPAPSITAITISPSDSAVSVGKTQQFSANATYSDGSSKDVTASASWQISDSTVATVSGGNVSGVKAGVVSVQVSSGSSSARAIVNVTSKNFNNASLKGAYVFTLITGEGAPDLQFEAGSISADGNGTISGVEDINTSGNLATQVPLTGTYAVTADGRGTLTLNTSGKTSRKLRFLLSANSATAGDNNGQLIEFDAAHNAIGTLARQDAAALANTALAKGTYVFRCGGLDGSQHPISSLGVFTLDSTGKTVSSGMEDVNDHGTINNGTGASTALSITGGSVGTVDASSGRASASLTVSSGTSHYAVYVISASRLVILGLDAEPMLGTAELQAQPAPAAVSSGGYLVQTDMGGVPGQFWMTGQFAVNSSSQFSGAALAEDGGLSVLFTGTPATITVGASGRGSFQQTTNQGALDCTFYMVSSNKIYLLQTNDSHAGMGVAELQSAGADGFGSINLNNTFVAGGAELGDGNVAFLAQYVSDGMGHIMGIEDVSQPQSGNPSQLATSTILFKANYGTPNALGGVQFNVAVPGAGVTSMSVLLQSASGGTFMGQPNDVDGWFLVQ